jgi:hypothetical protein
LLMSATLVIPPATMRLLRVAAPPLSASRSDTDNLNSLSRVERKNRMVL